MSSNNASFQVRRFDKQLCGTVPPDFFFQFNQSLSSSGMISRQITRKRNDCPFKPDAMSAGTNWRIRQWMHPDSFLLGQTHQGCTGISDAGSPASLMMPQSCPSRTGRSRGATDSGSVCSFNSAITISCSGIGCWIAFRKLRADFASSATKYLSRQVTSSDR